ncbi:lipopolysaccharide biosynthesis protein [Capnocytophaga sp. HP1101]
MNFVVGIVLARILLPEDFGLIGIATFFITVTNVFIEGGFGAALINKKNTTQTDYSTIFFINIGFSIFLYLLLYISSGEIALFFTNPTVKPLLQLLGLNIVLVSFELIHRTILIRELAFKKIAIVSLISVAISAVCAIVMAQRGWGVYSLLYRVLIGEAITVFLFWILNKWRPSWLFSWQSFKQLFLYGGNLLFSNLLNILQTNIYYVFIGKFFSTSALGYYTRAVTFRDLFSSNISTIVKKVSFSTLSKEENLKAKADKFFSFEKLTFLLVSFITCILFFASKEIILIILSSKWSESISILQILSLSGIFIVLYNLDIDYFAVLGNTDQYLRIELIGKLLIIPVLLVAYCESFQWLLYGIVIHSVVMFLWVSVSLNKVLKGVFKHQLFSVLKVAVIFVCLLLITYLTKDIELSNLYLSFILKSLVIGLFFASLYARDVKQIICKSKEI